MAEGEPNIYMSATICLIAAPLMWGFGRFVSLVLGMYHAPECRHRDDAGWVIVGTTRPEGLIYKTLKVGAVLSGALGAVLLALGATGAAAQPAPRALDTFQSVCAKDLSHDATAAALAADGWDPAPADLEALFGQDFLDPDDARRFAIDTGAGTILSAAMTEKRGLLGTRNRTLCFVRLFLETPDQIRADFRARMGTAPDDTIDSAEVRADIWGGVASGRVVGLRAVNLPEGFWMVTVSRTLADG